MGNDDEIQCDFCGGVKREECLFIFHYKVMECLWSSVEGESRIVLI